MTTTCLAFHFTGAFHSDVQAAHAVPIQRGSIIVVDRAYIDYELWAKWNTQGMFFVTRLRRDLQIEVVDEKTVPRTGNVIQDELINLSSRQGQRDYPFPLRRIMDWNPDTDELIVLLTNHLGFAASAKPLPISIVNAGKSRCFSKPLSKTSKSKPSSGLPKMPCSSRSGTALIALLFAPLASLSVPKELVFLESRFFASHELVYLSRSAGVAQGSTGGPATSTSTTGAEPLLIWTALARRLKPSF